MRLWRTLRRMKTAVLLLLSVSASESGPQSRSLSVFVARHNLSVPLTIADCDCDTDVDSDPDGLWSQFYFRNRFAPNCRQRRGTRRPELAKAYAVGLADLENVLACLVVFLGVGEVLDHQRGRLGQL